MCIQKCRKFILSRNTPKSKFCKNFTCYKIKQFYSTTEIVITWVNISSQILMVLSLEPVKTVPRLNLRILVIWSPWTCNTQNNYTEHCQAYVTGGGCFIVNLSIFFFLKQNFHFQNHYQGDTSCSFICSHCFFNLSVFLFICLFVCLSVCVSVHLTRIMSFL